MKQPLLILTTEPNRNPNASKQLPNVFRLPHGLIYAQWYVLSAFFNILFWVCWYVTPCPSGMSNTFCNIPANGLIGQCLLIISNLVVFLLGAVIIFLLSYRFLEAQQYVMHSRRGFWGFLWSFSDLEKLDKKHWPLIVGVVLIFVASIYALLENKMQPIPFALVLLSLFLTIWVLCNKALRNHIEEQSLKHEDIHQLTAGYLFRRLFSLHSFARKTPDDLATITVGMQKVLPKAGEPSVPTPTNLAKKSV